MAQKDHLIKQPRVAVGALVLYEDTILLVKRGNPPAQGKWALPGGRVEWGESLIQAVRREVLEETGISIQVGNIIDTFDSISHDTQGKITYHYVIIDFLAHPITPVPEPTAGDDADEAAWLTLAEIDKLPMSVTTLALIQKIVIDQNDG